jgi:nitrate/nitrite-specific signal transduction histidine kinase
MAIGFIVALVAIAATLIASQVLVQYNLQTQIADSHVINIAGRQRMLSQRLAKAALAIRFASDPGTRTMRVQELASVADLWEHSQNGLQYGDSTLGLPGHNTPKIAAMFVELEPTHAEMLANAHLLLDAVAKQNRGEQADPGWSPYVQGILKDDITFLTRMDAIVTEYDRDAAARVAKLRATELLLLGLALAVIGLIGAFVLAPIVKQVGQALTDLIKAQEWIAEQNEVLANRNRELESQRREIGAQRDQLSVLEGMLQDARALLERTPV